MLSLITGSSLLRFFHKTFLTNRVTAAIPAKSLPGEGCSEGGFLLHANISTCLITLVFSVFVSSGQLFAANALALTLTTTNATCNGSNNGSITATVTGGSGGSVNYTLTPGSVTNTTGFFSNLAAGTYTVSANDAGVNASATATITEPPASSTPSITFGSLPISCPAVTSVSLSYTSTNGSPVSYSIIAGTPAMAGFVPVTDASLGASPISLVLPPGVAKGSYQFVVTVKNAAGCISAAQMITLNFDDTTKPVFTVPSAITVFKDLSCNVNVDPSITGDVSGLSDNCTPASGLAVTHTDGAPVPVGGSCNLPYTISRTWRVTDQAGNFDEKTQVITVKDNIKPNLSLPSDASLSCEQSILPANTGSATATDNCSTTTMAYTDSVSYGSCGGNKVIFRTWSAVDCSGNVSKGVQRISVVDNTKPTATVSNKSVGCPSDIPSPYADFSAFVADGGTASDNCGTLTLSLFNEIANGLEGKPGYCPTSVTRIYRISDPCGNYTDVVQTISVLGDCGCSKCVAGTNFHLVDMMGQPTGTMTISDQQRNGACCVESNCISFNVRLDANAIGIEILIDGATPSPQDWRIDCANVSINGNVICMPGGSFHLFTFCKPGANKNSFTFRSVPGVITSGSINTRVECNGQLSASGIVSNPVWNSISPGAKGQYNSYLSSTTVANPVFNADINSPPIIQYEVCGNIGTTLCNNLGTDCAIATVYVKQKIDLVWNTNPAMVCVGNMPTLTANISPAGTYSYEWYSGYGAIGTPVYTGSASYQPTVAGPYSIKVTDTQSGIACNVATFNFDVTIDTMGPTVLGPQQPLTIQCGDPAAPQKIADWLATASATYTKPDGTVINLVPTNDYNGIPMACNASKVVTFSAADQCGNVTKVTSTITVIDTQAPVFTQCPANITVSVDASQCYASGVNLGTATATDVCSTPTVTNDAPAQLPVGNTLVTWTATDACGNKTTCTQTVTVKDNIKPMLGCPANVVQTALPGNCFLANVTIPDPVATDNCAIVLQTWTMSGATTGSSPATGINSVSGQTFNVGITTVTYTVADAAGNTASCTFDVWIKDLNKPVFTSGCPADITQTTDPGQCTAAVTIPTPTASDPCNEGFTIKNSFNNTNNASGNYPAGVTLVTWTITDASGNITTCSQKVTVTDNIKPTLSCPGNVTQTALPGNCSLANVVIPAPVATENCAIVLQTWTMSGATTGSSPATGINSVSGQTFNVGITTVTYTVADAAGNTASCTFDVWIKDLNKPVFTSGCPADIAQGTDPGQCTATVNNPAPPVNDPCNEGYTITNSFTNTANGSGAYPLGVTLVTWTITDASGNVTTCSQKVTVTDNIKPTLSCPGNVTQTALPGNCSLANVIIPAPVATDNCAIVLQTWTMSGATTGSSPATGINSVSGQTFNVGITTVTYTVADAAGNTASCTFDVWIKDLNKPVFTSGCPADIAQGTDPGQCTATVNNPAPPVNDPCNEGYTITNNFTNTANGSGAYPLGVTLVTWTITDASGNVTTCSQKVTVTDNIKPTLSCPGNVVQTALPGNCSLANVIIPAPVATDNCAIVLQTWTMSGATTGSSPATGINSVSGQTFNVGITTVTYTVADAAGNTASCKFDVQIKDLVKPVLTSGCPADIIQTADPGKCTATVTVPIPAVSDPCNEGFTIKNSFNNTDNASGIYPVGTTNVDWTITDVSGNVTTCSQKITINDRVPTLTCPADISVMADFEKAFATNVSVPPPTYGDDCPGLMLTWNMTGVTTGSSPATGVNIFPSTYLFNLGVTTIQYTVTDANGHSVTCTFTVTILAKPDIDCQPNITKNNDPGLCATSLDPGFPIKLSGAEPITYSWSMTGATPATGTATGIGAITPNPYAFNVGTTTITWTATNLAGADKCDQIITVEDKEPPLFSAPGPFEFCVEDLISAAIVSSALQINPTPDYFLFRKGNTTLNVNAAGFSDNCTPSGQLTLHWRIDFAGSTPPPPVTGTGEPSTYPNDIVFPGDGVSFLDVTHTITYWVVDLAGNESIHRSAAIVIHPRPVVSYNSLPAMQGNRINPTKTIYHADN